MNYNNDIAIIGLSGKYSGADSPNILWEKILKGIDLNIEISDTNINNKENYVNRCSFIEDIDCFDNEFFNFTPYEAAITDPQQRIFLECCFKALEDAGYANDNEKKYIGVFGSSTMSSYLINNIYKNSQYNGEELNYSILIGNDKDFLATRVAYKLNLCGPAMTIQTACSSSLVSLHYACQSLLNYECDAALVGSVSILIPQKKGYYYKAGGILSKDGYCRPFDNDSSGTIKGNGCSVIVIKRLEEAMRDNDNIYAIIKGTAVNNDGADKIGFTAPSVKAEASVIEEALSFSEIQPSQIDYIEAHGTGTRLGDPIEMKALNNVFKNVENKIPIGSIKANIGHLDVASGLTSIIKGIYMLNNNLIPPNIYFKNLNSEINNLKNKFYFPVELENKQMQNIGISSFGLGGTNAHAVLAKKIEKIRRCESLSCYLLPISYLRKNDLFNIQKGILPFIKDNECIQDFIYTMSVGKKRFEHNVYFVFKNKEELVDLLQNSNFDNLKKDEKIQFPKLSLHDFQEIYEKVPYFRKIYNELKFDNNGATYLYFKIAFICFLNNIGIFKSPNLVINDEIDKDILKSVQRKNIAEIINTHMNYNCSCDVIHDDVIKILFDFIGRVSISVYVDFEKLYSGLNWRRISVPNYPLEKKSFWIEPDKQERMIECKEIQQKKSGKMDFTEEVINIWKAVLGTDDINKDSDFYDIGGESLLAIDILDKINKRFLVKLSLQDFLKLNTPELIGEFLSKNILKHAKSSFVVNIRNSKTNKKNMFLIHPAGGTTFCYRVMNRYLSCDMNIYAIDLPEFYTDVKNMEQLAKVYLDEIIKIQKNGPYIIGGYSFGGNLAYEIVAQLEDMGKLVEKVIFFDSHPPLAYNSYNGEDVNYDKVLPIIINSYLNNKNNTPINIEKFKGKDFKNIIENINPKAMMDGLITEEDMKYFYDKWIYNHMLLKNHKPVKKVNANAVIFKATENEDEYILNTLKIKVCDKELWRNYINGNIEVIDVSGNHYSMFGDKVNIMYLAEKLNSLMNTLVENS